MAIYVYFDNGYCWSNRYPKGYRLLYRCIHGTPRIPEEYEPTRYVETPPSSPSVSKPKPKKVVTCVCSFCGGAAERISNKYWRHCGREFRRDGSMLRDASVESPCCVGKHVKRAWGVLYCTGCNKHYSDP